MKALDYEALWHALRKIYASSRNKTPASSVERGIFDFCLNTMDYLEEHWDEGDEGGAWL